MTEGAGDTANGHENQGTVYITKHEWSFGFFPFTFQINSQVIVCGGPGLDWMSLGKALNNAGPPFPHPEHEGAELEDLQGPLRH